LLLTADAARLVHTASTKPEVTIFIYNPNILGRVEVKNTRYCGLLVSQCKIFVDKLGRTGF